MTIEAHKVHERLPMCNDPCNGQSLRRRFRASGMKFIALSPSNMVPYGVQMILDAHLYLITFCTPLFEGSSLFCLSTSRDLATPQPVKVALSLETDLSEAS